MSKKEQTFLFQLGKPAGNAKCGGGTNPENAPEKHRKNRDISHNDP
jgi:hypothetical protein